jgi:hypothetical protein
MVERVIKATTSGWRPWAIGAAALSMVGAAVVYFWAQRSTDESDEVYEAWWRHRDTVRANGANGHQPAETPRTGNPQLFV